MYKHSKTFEFVTIWPQSVLEHWIEIEMPDSPDL